jgi:hypothetical protein
MEHGVGVEERFGHLSFGDGPLRVDIIKGGLRQ